MKIRDNFKIGLPQLEKVYKAPESKPTGNKLPVAENVNVSMEARILAATRGPEEPDESKISALKEAIRADTFKIDLGRIAEAIMNEESSHELSL